jgi:hypothetical protein
MATRNSSEVQRRRVRLNPSRPLTHPRFRSDRQLTTIVKARRRDDRPGQLDQPRVRLFKAMSIIACCRLACASLLADGGDMEVIVDALQAAHDLIDSTVGQL